MQERKALDATAYAVMLALTAPLVAWARHRAPRARRDEPLSARFGLAALAVGAGIALVNLRR